MNPGPVYINLHLAEDSTQHINGTKACYIAIICVLSLLECGWIMAAKIGLGALQTKHTSCLTVILS